MKTLLGGPQGFLWLLLLVSVLGCSRPEPAAEPVRSVRVVAVGSGRLSPTQEYAAEVRSRVESRLAFRVSGKLIQRKVEVGQSVRAGQLLAQLDPADLRLGEDAAQAAMRAAKANADQAAADYQRYVDLKRQGFISDADLERRESLWKAAQAQWELARSQAALQINQTRHGALLADADGVVTSIEAEVGAVLAAGTPVIRLAWDGPRDVVFTVPEDRVDEIRGLQGKSETLRVRFWGADPAAAAARATVREVAAAADPATRTFQVKASLSGASPRLGQSATVVRETPSAAGVIRLPSTAVLEQQGGASVWVVDPVSMTVKTRAVRLTGADGKDVTLDADLKPGEWVVTAGVHTLTAGQKVRLFQQAPPPPSVASSPSAISR